MGRVDLGWQNGKRQYRAVYGRTRRAVADALRDELKAAEDGTLLNDKRQTVGQFLTRWLRDVAQARVRPSTFQSYEGTIALHIAPYLGKHRLATLSPEPVQAWMTDLERNGVTVACRRYARVVLRNALNTAVRWKLTTRNAATLIDAPRAVSKEIQPLTVDQAKQLLATAKGHPLEAFVAVALTCGLRLGEGLGLKWDDLDFDKGTLQVRGAIQRSGGDPAARRPLLAERKRLMDALTTAQSNRSAAEDVARIRQALAENRAALRTLKTSLHVVEPKSTRSRRTILRSRRRRSRRCVVTASGSSRRDSRPARPGRTTGSSLPRPSAPRLSLETSPARSRRCSHARRCRPSGCMTCGTRARPCCSPKVSTRAWSWKRSATRKSA
jgi:site-specific recombinase XerC